MLRVRIKILSGKVSMWGVKKYTRWDYKRYKELARAFAHQSLAKYNTVYGFKIGRVSIRNTKSRWGSCSSKGHLNFNYKIVWLPARLAEYIVVHELCHLGEFNHSPKFWALVAQTFPDHKKLRKELKQISAKFN